MGVAGESGNLVLDKPNSQIKPWSRVPYRWVRIQKPNNSRLWATISGGARFEPRLTLEAAGPSDALSHPQSDNDCDDDLNRLMHQTGVTK